MDTKLIGTIIAQYRKKSGMTQAELSERMGSKQCSVSNWLTGKTMPTLPLLYGLCKVLQVSSDKLLGLEADS